MSEKLYFIFVFAHLCVFGLGLESEGWPGYAYSPQLRGCLKLHSNPARWLDAKVNCLNEGALLISPWTSNFTSAVYELQSNQRNQMDVLFSGALLTFPDRNPYKDSAKSSPVILDRCGVFFSNGTTGDVDCDLQYPYVCFAPKCDSHDLASETTTLAPIHSLNDSGYEYSKPTGYFYKFHTKGMTWPDASLKCVSENATLAIINSDDEAAALVEIFERQPVESINKINDAFINHVAIGVRMENGIFKTVDGLTTKEAGYDKWVDASFTDNYPYGTMRKDGKLHSGNSGPWMFICEKA